MHISHANLFYLGMVIETEGHDRSDINLPGSQLQLLQDSANTAIGELLVCNNNQGRQKVENSGMASLPLQTS